MFSKITRTFNSFLKILFISLTIFAVCLGNTSAKVPSFEKLVGSPCKAKVFRKDWKKSGLFQYNKKHLAKNNSETNRRIAYHEAGHAIITALLGAKVNSIKMFNKKIFYFLVYKKGGLTKFNGTLTHDDLIKIFLAGYVAEKIIFGETTYGFEDDLDKASMLAFLKKNKDLDKNGQKSIAEILQENLNTVTDMINKNINKLRAVAKALLKKKKLSENKVTGLINNAEK